MAWRNIAGIYIQVLSSATSSASSSHQYHHHVLCSTIGALSLPKTSVRGSLIQYFILQFPESSRFCRVIQQLLMSSYSSSRPFYLSFSNAIQKAVCYARFYQPSQPSFFLLQDLGTLFVLIGLCKVSSGQSPKRHCRGPGSFQASLCGIYY